jgi:two-component system, chemotaxis family, protein-glutamate methylesterase/glutaminase
VSQLPADLPASLFVVLHVPRHGTSVLPAILRRAGPLPAVHPSDGEPIVHGRIYVAPPDSHLLVGAGRVRLTRGPTENGHRPAIDPLFRSGARAHGPRVVGVILSGTLDDGTAGLATIKACGGVAVVQSPDEALYTGMPTNAIEHVSVDHILPVSAIAALLIELAHQPVSAEPPNPPADLEIETDVAALLPEAVHRHDRPGTPSGFACPDCGGVLWELPSEDMVRFRCRTGHAWSMASLITRQATGVEEALWAALRALEENAALARRLEERARQRGNARGARHFREETEAATARAELIRRLLLTGDVASNGEAADDDALSSGEAAGDGETATGSLAPGPGELARPADEPA